MYVVMVGLDWSVVNEKHTLQETAHALEAYENLTEPIFKYVNNGKREEPQLYFFENPLDAVTACLSARKAIAAYNKEHPDLMIPYTGMGIHTSDLLIIPGTDVHWGDAGIGAKFN